MGHVSCSAEQLRVCSVEQLCGSAPVQLFIQEWLNLTMTDLILFFTLPLLAPACSS